MQTMPLIILFAAWEDSAAVFMARIVGINGTPITQATIQSIAYTVGTIDKNEDGDEVYTAIIESTPLQPADVISDTLLTALPWRKDAVGRNFTHEMASTAFPSAHKRYRIQYLFTPVTGGASKSFPVVFEGKINELFGQ